MAYLARSCCAFLGTFLIAAVPISNARAGDSPFGYLYTADTHPKGEFEFEQWLTARKGSLDLKNVTRRDRYEFIAFAAREKPESIL